jgi:uncharacterized protein (DUF697 family)/uncharacterized tellurite resistance protein B-like protein
MNEELLSGIKVLVALAKADGEVHAGERLAIENALDAVELPEGTTVMTLLDAAVDLDGELARVHTADVKRRIYDAACALVYVDGDFSKDEKAMVARIAAAFGITDGEERAARFQNFTSAVPPTEIAAVSDPKKRAEAVDAEIQSAAEFGGALAASTLPVAAESCLFTNNVRLARNIGLAYGAKADEAFWRTFVSNVLGAAGSWFAVTSLLKLVPGYDSSGAAAAYATTRALGQTTRRYFDEGESLDASALQKEFHRAKKEALSVAKAAKSAIAARKEKLATAKAELDADLALGKLAETAYADALVAL